MNDWMHQYAQMRTRYLNERDRADHQDEQRRGLQLQVLELKRKLNTVLEASSIAETARVTAETALADEMRRNANEYDFLARQNQEMTRALLENIKTIAKLKGLGDEYAERLEGKLSWDTFSRKDWLARWRGRPAKCWHCKTAKREDGQILCSKCLDESLREMELVTPGLARFMLTPKGEAAVNECCEGETAADRLARAFEDARVIHEYSEHANF